MGVKAVTVQNLPRAEKQVRAEAFSEAERGSSSLASLGLALVLLLLGVTLAGLLGLVTASQRAAKAADLAALVAADTARGLRAGQPCDQAKELAQANGAQLLACQAHPQLVGVMDVRTSVPVAGPLAWLGPAEGLARAGPPEPRQRSKQEEP